MKAPVKPQGDPQFSEQEVARRRDEALRRALNSPPKPHKDMKLGKRKPKPKPKPSAPSAKR
jgi:hypothetical protein